MLKRTLVLFILALAQVGCDINYGENLYPLEPWNLEEVRSRLEREKREFLKIEELQVGNGAIASWGRRLKAEIEVRYADDGTTIYKGPIVTCFGFKGLLPSYSVIASCWSSRTKLGSNWGSMAWPSVDAGVSLSAKNWSVEVLIPAAICFDPNVSSSMRFPFTKRRWLSRPL